MSQNLLGLKPLKDNFGPHVHNLNGLVGSNRRIFGPSDGYKKKDIKKKQENSCPLRTYIYGCTKIHCKHEENNIMKMGMGAMNKERIEKSRIKQI